MVLAPWELMLFLFIILLFIYLFILGKISIYNKIKILHNFQKVKLESHSEELGLLKPSTFWLHPQEA